MLTRRQIITGGAALGLSTALGGLATGCSKEPDEFDLTILATSDTHGKFLPWNYAANAEDYSGSLAQVVTAIEARRTPTTLLLDAGDTIQDNCAELFQDDPVHPMVVAMNAMGYDACTTGNHEYNFGMDVTRKYLSTVAATPLLCNLRDPQGNPLADSYTIITVNGVRVGIIGAVTPLIGTWDKTKLEGYTITDPVEAIAAVIEQLEGQTDVLVALVHMGLKNEYEVAHTSATDLANACPQLDVIVAAHEHNKVDGTEINGVTVVENAFAAQSLAEVRLHMVRQGGAWTVADKSSTTISMAAYDPDPQMEALLAPYDRRAKEFGNEAIGQLLDGPLVPADEIPGLPQALVECTPLGNLLGDTMLHYSGADVVASNYPSVTVDIQPGTLKRYHASQVYKYANVMDVYRITGAQLRRYMEWAVQIYNTYQEGDLTVSFNTAVPYYNLDVFNPLTYQVDISQPVGSRIVNPTWPDGHALTDDEVLTIAVTDYRGNSMFGPTSEIFSGDDRPTLVQSQVYGHIGGIRSLLVDYIQNVLEGQVHPRTEANWRLVGNDWDPELHAKAVEQVRAGLIVPVEPDNNKTFFPEAIKTSDLQ